MRVGRRLERGFTLIELLVTVAIIGVLSATAIWNYFIAINRAKQKQTMGNMRSIALAWESFATDYGDYTAAGAAFSFPAAVTYDTLKERLVPNYTMSLPKNDAWGTPFDFGFESGANSYYAIRSLGADKTVDSSYESQVTKDFNCDIIYANGQFVVYPHQIIH